MEAVGSWQSSCVIVCCYDEYWIGISGAVDDESMDVKLKFMHPSYPARSFSWPNGEDICLFLVHNICTIKEQTTATGCQYQFGCSDITAIDALNKERMK